MASVELTGLSKRFQRAGSAALEDVSLTIADSEFLVIVGPSGCGKSTLLRIVAGLELADEGEIRIAGRRVDQWSPQRRNVAMVFQNYALYPHMTVQKNLEFPLRLQQRRRDEIESRVGETAELLNLGALLQRRPAQLSGGERQRVAMGRALVRSPSVFLMDEPLSNLDAKLRVKIRSEISALQKRVKVTTLYVTHDQTEAMTLGHRVAVMRGGTLQQVDAPLTLYDCPANTFVAGFLGNPGMNVFPATLSRAPDVGLVLVAGQQRIPLTGVRSEPPSAALGGDLLVGIRPEALMPDTDLTLVDQGRLELLVESVETIGHEKLVYGNIPEVPTNSRVDARDGAQIVARLPMHNPVRAGQRIRLSFPLERVYLFDADGVALPRLN